jgi:RNA polymerase sigma-70 factor, ECF subfamily
VPGVDQIVVEQVFREAHGRAVATLIRRFGDITAAEDAVAEAFTVAVARWRRTGVPPDPAGWIVTTAGNRAIDEFRSTAARRAREQVAAELAGPRSDDVGAPDTGPLPDDRLRLIFTCCHPALAPAAQVALTLRLLGGLTTAEVAAAFLVPETTMAQRIVRAKRKIAAARIPYRVPDDTALPARLRSVLAVLYLIATEAHSPAGEGEAVRPDLEAEAVRLTRVLVELMPDEEEAVGLLALLLFLSARRASRVDPSGQLVLLGEQDRHRWDAAMVAEARERLRWCLDRGRPGPYQLQACIQAVHADAAAAGATDWAQILAIYDQLQAIAPSPVVRLNRAVALAEVAGPAAALAAVEELTAAHDLDAYPPLHAVRADLLRRAGHPAAARAAWSRAIDLTSNPASRTLMARRRDEIPG